MTTAVAERPAGLMVMTAESVTPQAFECEVEALEAKAAGYQSLVVSGTSDKTGLKAVREARLDLARVRCDIERRRKEIKEGAVVFGRAVDAEAKRLTALVEPTELALKAIEDDIAKEEQREKDKRTAERMEQLKAVASRYPEVVIAAMSEKDFGKLLVELTADFTTRQEKAKAEAEERARLKAEDDERQRVAAAEIAAEREKLRLQREEQEAKAREQEAERKRLDAIEEKQISEERARLKAEDDVRQRIAAAEQKAREDQERSDKEAADAARREAMQPDYDKLVDVARALRKLKLPTVSDGASVARNRIKLLIEETASEVEQIAANECGVSIAN